MAGALRSLLLLMVTSWVVLGYKNDGYGTNYADSYGNAGYGGVPAPPYHHPDYNHYAVPVPAPAPVVAVVHAPSPVPQLPHVHVVQMPDVPNYVAQAHQGFMHHVDNFFGFNDNHHSTTRMNIDEILPTTKPGSQDCKDIPDPRCKFPFTYKGRYYNHCIGKDAFAKKWCSTDRTNVMGYKDSHSWAYCQRQCVGGDNTGKIIAGVAGGAAAAAAAGVVIAMVVKNEQEKSSTLAPPGFVTEPGTPPPYAPEPGTPPPYASTYAPVMGSTTAGLYEPPAPQRLYEADQKVAPAAGGLASYFSGPALAIFGMLALFTLVAIVGTLHRHKKKAQKPSLDATVPHDSESNISGLNTEFDEEPLLASS